MTGTCENIQSELLELGWTAAQRQQAQRLLEHLRSCEACQRAAAEYESLRAAAQSPGQGEPVGGWDAFEDRLARSVKKPARWGWWIAAAAGLSIAIAALAAVMMQGFNKPHKTFNAPLAVSPEYLPSDLTTASAAEAFRKVSQVFDGRAGWVMLSDHESDVGLSGEPLASSELLVLRLVVTRGAAAVSQMHVAVVPGSTVRVTVPSSNGASLQYVITTDAANLQNIGVALAVEDRAGDRQQAGLGSMATTLTVPYGKNTPTGRITTRDGTFDLSMTLEKTLRTGAGTGGAGA